jgi:hypothetical protein
MTSLVGPEFLTEGESKGHTQFLQRCTLQYQHGSLCRRSASNPYLRTKKSNPRPSDTSVELPANALLGIAVSILSGRDEYLRAPSARLCRSEGKKESGLLAGRGIARRTKHEGGEEHQLNLSFALLST